MKQWHVNQNTGAYDECNAKVKECPLKGDIYHTDDKEDAIYHSEVALAKIHGLVQTTRKTPGAADIQPRINHKFPYPAASRLEKLDTVLYSLNTQGGVNTQALGQVLDHDPRVADYYGEAASFIGLAEAVVNEKGHKSYALNQTGRDYIAQDTVGREDILRRAVQSIDIVPDLEENNISAAMKRARSLHGENEETVKRRLSSVKSWMQQVDQENFLQDVNIPEIEEQTAEAMELYERNAIQEAQQPERAGEICDSCFMEKPLTGVCPNCDD